MTEEEAKTKWCPKAQIAVVESGAASNRESFALASQKGYDLCLGSACMAWRTWNISSQNYDERISECRDRGMTLEHAIKFVNEHSGNVGYCGLAGKP